VRSDHGTRWLQALELPGTALGRAVRDETYLASPGSPTISLREKLVAETALLLLVGSRACDDEVVHSPIVRFVARTLTTLTESQRARILLHRYPCDVTTLALPQLATLAYENRIRRLCLSSAQQSLNQALERWLFSDDVGNRSCESFKRAEVDWLRREWTALLGHPLPTPPIEIVRLPAPIHPIYTSNQQAYALTHELMFISSFGHLEISASPEDLRAMADVLDSHIAWCVVSDRIDLLAEFLICVVVLGLPPSRYWQIGLTVLRSVWDAFGIIPAHNFRHERRAGRRHGGAKDNLVLRGYHGTLVAGLLESVLLSTGLSLDSAVPEVPSVLSREEVIDHVQRGGRTLGWWARCIDDAGGNLAILADGLLTQAAVNYEVDAVKDLYDLRIVRGEPVTATMRAAADFCAADPRT
jgi:hypothetical protein